MVEFLIRHGGDQEWMRLDDGVRTLCTRADAEMIIGADNTRWLYGQTYEMLLEYEPDADALDEYAVCQCDGSQYAIQYVVLYGTGGDE